MSSSYTLNVAPVDGVGPPAMKNPGIDAAFRLGADCAVRVVSRVRALLDDSAEVKRHFIGLSRRAARRRREDRFDTAIDLRRARRPVRGRRVRQLPAQARETSGDVLARDRAADGARLHSRPHPPQFAGSLAVSMHPLAPQIVPTAPPSRTQVVEASHVAPARRSSSRPSEFARRYTNTAREAPYPLMKRRSRPASPPMDDCDARTRTFVPVVTARAAPWRETARSGRDRRVSAGRRRNSTVGPLAVVKRLTPGRSPPRRDAAVRGGHRRSTPMRAFMS